SSGEKSSSLRKWRPFRFGATAVMVTVGSFSNGGAHQRTVHALTATAALADFRSVDRQHFDTGLAHERVGVLVALVGDDHARLESDGVVARIQLLAIRLPRV